MSESENRTNPSRRQMLKRGAIVGGTLVWAVPTVQTVSKAALAAVGSPDPKDSTPTPTPEPTPDPTPTPTPEPTPTPTKPAGNPCASIGSPGYWKNYKNHMSDAQFYALLKATQNFGPTFAALSQTNAISRAVTILGLAGNNFAQQILTSQINVARDPALGNGTMVGYTGTVNHLLATAYARNGSGNNAPYTNGNLTAQDKDVIGYLKGGGENDSATKCRVAY